LREALARIDNDFVLSEPRRKSTKRAHGLSFLAKPKLIAAFAAKYANLIMGLAFLALLSAVLFNALAGQNSRHPAPLFGHSVTIETKPEVKVTEAQVDAPQPAARPSVLPQPAAPAAPAAPVVNTPHGRDPMAEAAQLQAQKPAVARERDQIAQLLKTPAAAAPTPAPVESSKTIVAAQHALMKLGYVIKPDGLMGPVFHQTLEQFERDHGLQANGTLTPKIMHMLSVQSGIAVD
jgi:hypothetical protein